MRIRNITFLIVAACLALTTTGCKKFLNVTPLDALSGNNFWEKKQDAEDFTAGIYARLRDRVGGTPTLFSTNDRMFFPALEMRGNFVSVNATNFGSANATPANNLINNNLKPIISATSTYDVLLKANMDWSGFYEIVAASNILYQEVDRIPTSAISDVERNAYKGEAVFLRNLAYLYICKMYGDAVYYTNAYQSTSLARTPQLQVMKQCIADMSAAKDFLPVTYSNQNSKGFRPTKASAVALLMHLNMWAAAWDTQDKNQYYQSVLNLANELATYTEYRILPVNAENTKKIFKGRSEENLFGILQDFNYGEAWSPKANYAFFFAYYPYNGASTRLSGYCFYDKDYITALYGTGNDARVSTWFENYSAGNTSFQFKKFANVYATGSGSTLSVTNDDSAMIFRLPDMILLAAEAAAELGNETQAQDYVNQVRNAAGASAITTTGSVLKDDIYKERCRELIGEGQFFFDLVRTKRVINSEFTKAPMSVTEFNNGAWTWPLIISATERSANPYLIGNNFWN